MLHCVLGFIFQQVSLDVTLMKHRHSFVAIGGHVCTVSLFMTLLTGTVGHVILESLVGAYASE